MELALIEMPTEVAREQLRKYRRALHRRADAEYSEIAKGLECLVEGTPLISLSRVFAGVSRDDRGRPAIAIARADRRRVQYRPLNNSDEFDCGYDSRRGPPPRDSVIAVPKAPGAPTDGRYGYALLPLIPPDVSEGRDLRKYFVLWEVERWANSSRDVGPDVDPFLLQRISADLYAVVAQWDLSPLEQAILSGRRFV